MKQIPQAFIQDVLARCDLIELIEARVPLRKKGNNYSANCPFHDEKTPSFNVSATKQLYHCFGCGVGGNAISFLMEFERLTFVEAIELLAHQAGLVIPYEVAQQQTKAKANSDLYGLMLRVSRYYQKQLRNHMPAIDYLKQRGLSGYIAKEFGIGFALPAWDALLNAFNVQERTQLHAMGLIANKTGRGFYDHFRERIMFPIRDKRGRVIGFGGRIIGAGEPKYLNSPETTIFHKGRELYGLYEAYQATRTLTSLIVVEGYMDVVALAQHGIRNAVATLGTAITSEHIRALQRATSTIIFCFDGDRAGQAAAWRALEVTLPLLQDDSQIRFLLLPPEHDPDSIVRAEGAEYFIECTQTALPLADFLFNTLTQQVDLSSLQGRAHLTKLAVPLLNQLAGNVVQHMLFERLAQLVRMDSTALKNLTQSTLDLPVPTMPRLSSARSPMRQMLALLLQLPNLVQSLPPQFALTEFILPGTPLLKQLITLIQTMPTITTAALLEHWRDDHKTHQQLMQLALFEIVTTPDDQTSVFLGTLKRLQQLNRDRHIEQLTAKLQAGQLAEIDKLKLQTLLAASK